MSNENAMLVGPAATEASRLAVEKMQATGQLPSTWWMHQMCWDMIEKLCARFAGSTMVPKDFEGKPGNVFVALSAGLPLGLSPLACLQSIAVINGRPSLWGDAPASLILARPDLVEFSERATGSIEAGDRCWTIKIVRRMANGTMREVERSFSVDDAKRAKLWGRTGREGQPTPWVTNPDRMLFNRARAFAQRDAFSDVLLGVTLLADTFEDGERTADAEFVVRDEPVKASTNRAKTEPVDQPAEVEVTDDGFDAAAPRRRKSRHTHKAPKTPRVGDTYGHLAKGERCYVCTAIEDGDGPVWTDADGMTLDLVSELTAIVEPHVELAAMFEQVVDDEGLNDEPETTKVDNVEPLTPASAPAPRANTNLEPTAPPVERPTVIDQAAEEFLTPAGKPSPAFLPSWVTEMGLTKIGTAFDDANQQRDVLVGFEAFSAKNQPPRAGGGQILVRFLPGGAIKPRVQVAVAGQWQDCEPKTLEALDHTIRAAFGKAIASLIDRCKMKPDEALAAFRAQGLDIGEPVVGWLEMGLRQLVCVWAWLTRKVR